MRALTTQEQRLLTGVGYSPHTRVRVLRNGVWHDLTNLQGYDWLRAVEWGEGVDDQVASATVQCKRAVRQLSLAQFMQASRLNLDAGAYVPLLRPGREFVVETAITPLGVEPAAGDWRAVFHGKIDRVSSGDPVEFSGRGLGCDLQDAFIETERTYGSTAGTPLHTVMQSILTDNATGVVMHVPTAPTFLLRPDVQKKQSVLEALRDLAALIGWDVRYVWRAATGWYELTLVQPDRAKTALDWTWTPDLYTAADLSVDRSDVRNAIRVVYSDPADLDATGSPKRKTVEVSDASSIALYGRKFMEIAEASTSQIDTAAEATTMAQAALADLKDPLAEVAMDVPLFWCAELGDLYRFAANDEHTDAALDLAVVGFRHSVDRAEGGKAMTRLELRGKPCGMHADWLERDARPGVAQAAPFTGPDAPPSITCTPIPRGATFTFPTPTTGSTWDAFELHVSTVSGFIPDATTLKATASATRFDLADLEPGTTYYVRVVPRDASGNRGIASPEGSFVAGYVTAADVGTAAISVKHLLHPPAENLIPNGYSEAGTAALGLTYEGAGLVNDPANAREGIWCRRFTFSTLNYFETPLSPPVPCAAGDFFFGECWAKLSAVLFFAPDELPIYYQAIFRNGAGAEVGRLVAPLRPEGDDLGTTYRQFTFQGTAPANACSIQPYIATQNNADPTDSGKHLYVDAISLRKGIKADMVVGNRIQTSNYDEEDGTKGSGMPIGSAIAGFKADSQGTALKVADEGLQIGRYTIGTPFVRSLNALGSKSNRFFYRGNTSPAVGNGIPWWNALEVFVQQQVANSARSYATYALIIYPKADTDNLDGLRYVEVEFHRGSPSSAQFRATRYFPITDRKYFNAASPGDAGNHSAASVHFELPELFYATSHLTPTLYLKCTLTNVYGRSASMWFVPPTTEGNYFTKQSAAPFAGGTSGGGGSGGGDPIEDTCPAPEELILLANGREVQAQAVQVDDLVLTGHEHSALPGIYRVTHVSRHENQWRWKLYLTDGRTLVAHRRHRMYVEGRGFLELHKLLPGDRVHGPAPGVVARVEDVGRGPTIKLTVGGAHTYVNNGLLSHNAKPR